MARPPRSPTMLAGSVAVSGGGYYGPNWGGVAAGVAVGIGVAAMASSAAAAPPAYYPSPPYQYYPSGYYGWHPAESVRTSSLKGSMSRCSRGISYATPMREPTQAECFAYDVWNKSCPGAFSLADPCAGGGWCSHFAVGFGGLPQRREGCVAGRPTRAHRDGRVARRGGEGIADRRDPAPLSGRSRLSRQRQDPRTARRCRDAGQKGGSPRPARPAAISSGLRGRQSRGCEGGCRVNAEPSPGIPAERTAEEWSHHPGRLRSGAEDIQ